MRQFGWIFVLLVLAGLAAPAPAVTLQWKLKEGDQFFLEEKVLQKQTLKFMGSDLKKDLALTRVTHFQVLNKTDKEYVLQQKIVAVRFSRPKESDKGEAGLERELEGAVFKVTLSPQLRVIRFEGYEALIKKIAKKDDVARMVRTLLPEKKLSGAVEALFAFLPDKDVAAGAEWSVEMTRSLGPLGNLRIENKYTFTGPAKDHGKDVVQIEFVPEKSTYVPPKMGKDTVFQVANGDIKVDRKKTHGTIFFAAVAGRPVQADQTTQLYGNLTVTSMGTTLKMDVEQEETIAMRILAKNPLQK